MIADREDSIFKHLFISEQFVREVIPYLKPEYFSDERYRAIYDEYNTFFEKYNTVPTIESIIVQVGDRPNVTEEEYNEIVTRLDSFRNENGEVADIGWLVDETEKFCSESAIHRAVEDSINILNGNDETQDKGAIPSLLQDALGVSFDSSVGHNYIDDAAERYDSLHIQEDRMATDLYYLDKVTRGGFVDKTLNVFMGGAGSGKSAIMIHIASQLFLQGKNVLYISLELSEERIGERLDSNILGIDLSKIQGIDREKYLNNVNDIKDRSSGRMVIKEYPTASAHVGHFRHLVRELKTKQNFVPDIIFIDYLNICSSSRAAKNANSYTIVKNIAEELRGFAIENECPIVSATQVNRGGLNASDMEMGDVSESAGLLHTVDTLFGMISTDQLREQGKIIFKQLKNRFYDISSTNKFAIGVDFKQMRFFNLDQDDMNNAPPNDGSDIGGAPQFGMEQDSMFAEKKQDGNPFDDFII